MVDFHPVQWAEQHPLPAAGIVFGGGLVLLWALGFFSRSGSNDSGTANMAAAYYAAEAQQAVIGGQIQQTTLTTAATTKQAEIQAHAATSIAQIQATTDQTIAAGQYATAQQLGLASYAADVTKAGYAADVAKTSYSYGYLTDVTKAAYSADVAKVQSYDARMTAQSHDYYGNLTAEAGLRATALTDAMHTLVAPEIVAGAGYANVSTPFGGFNVGPGAVPYNVLLAQGLTPAQAAYLGGFGGV